MAIYFEEKNQGFLPIMSNLKAGQCLATCHGGDATKEQPRGSERPSLGDH